MKKLKLILCMLLVAVCAAAIVAFTACKDESGTGNNNNTEQNGGTTNPDDTDPDGTDPDGTDPDGGNTDPALKDITGVTLANATVTYDGEVHSLEIAGTLPEGVSVAYENNNKTDAGKYTVKATLSGEGYNTLVLTATLTIEKATITGITMAGDTVTYNGEVHSLEIAGTLPEGVSVVYENNGKTDAGTYTVKATLSGDNYNTLTISATLTIEKADITGISFDGATVTYNGEAHSLEITGTLPEGVSVTYENNGKIEAGSYEVTAILSGKNYNTLTLTAVLHILPNLSSLAESIMEKFGSSTPDVWDYLPESFRLENRTYTGSQTIDFTTAKSISAIPVVGIGKQLDVIYGTVIDMQNLLDYADKLYAAANGITGLYQEYINTHPDDYKVFEGQTDGGAVGFRIELTDEQYKLLAKIGPASIELTSNPQTDIYTGRIQITDSNALKFEVGEHSLTVALNLLGHAVSQLMFVRTDNVVTCHMYETLYFGETTLMETSALLTWSGNTVEVCGSNGDFFLGSKGQVVELYDATTGKYLGSKVKETISSIQYNTYWFNLSDIGGINSIRVIEESHSNGTLAAVSPYTVYINGSSNYFVPKLVGGLGTKMRSRRYDIEMKKTYYYVNDGAEGYQKIEIEIPMLSVQAENYSTLVADVNGENSNLTITDNVPASTITMLDLYYEIGLEAYEEIAGIITPQGIADYVGIKDKWFN